MEQQEIWKDIKGFEGLYQVSNFGRVKSIRHLKTSYCGAMRKNHILATQDKGDFRYKLVTLRVKGKSRSVGVHRLVAEAFLPNPQNLPVINHRDENPSNNHVDNLEWCTQRKNVLYSMALHDRLRKEKPQRNRDKERPICAFTKDGAFVGRFESIIEASLSPIVTTPCLRAVRCRIRQCLRGEIPYAGGYKWKYESDVDPHYLGIRRAEDEDTAAAIRAYFITHLQGLLELCLHPRLV